jgi:hypothetical protein
MRSQTFFKPLEVPKGLGVVLALSEHGHVGAGVRIVGPVQLVGLGESCPEEGQQVVPSGRAIYRLRRRCPGTWWSPPPSKRLVAAPLRRRVRFPSTSATSTDRASGAARTDAWLGFSARTAGMYRCG